MPRRSAALRHLHEIREAVAEQRPGPVKPAALSSLIDGEDTKALYDYMKAHGSALAVFWDEVAETFVCTWQVGARQIVGTSWHPRVAIVAAAAQALS